MRAATVAQPDITLLLDLKGVIREATLSNDVCDVSVDDWIGRPWTETVADVGADKVQQMVAEACERRVSLLRQVTQCFPDGHERLIEYTTVRLGGNAGLIAVGKDLRAVSDLQARLVAAQRTMEREYWKLRHIETIARPVIGAAEEAVLTVRGRDLEIIEANPAAVHALRPGAPDGARITGRALLPEIAHEDREAVLAMLRKIRDRGRAPGLLARLGAAGDPWLVRASFVDTAQEATFRIRLSPSAGGQSESEDDDRASINLLIDRLPDGIVTLDRRGRVLRCNPAFLDLIQVGTERAVIGESLGRWLSRPGADLEVLLNIVEKQGFVRMFETAVAGAFGVDTDVEISAASDHPSRPEHFALIVRDVSRRLPESSGTGHLSSVLAKLERQSRSTTLRSMVHDTVAVVERFYIEDALERTGGNRTAAAELLGLSRQSLYTKIDRYALDGDSQANRQRTG